MDRHPAESVCLLTDPKAVQNPTSKSKSVVKGPIMSPDAGAQAFVWQRCFLSDTSFDHPLCAIAQTGSSRDTSLPNAYQWLRVMFNSGSNTIRIGNKAKGEANTKVVVDANHHLVPRFRL